MIAPVPRGPVVGALLLLALAACARHLPAAMSPPTASSAPMPPSEGTVSYSALADPAPNPPRPAAGEEFYLPSPFADNRTPIYPPRPLEAGAGDATVVVRIVIGPNGSVSRIADSPVMGSTAGPFAADFRGAVEEAIRSWRFQPARVEKSEEGKDFDGDGKADYRLLVDEQEIPFYVDIRFDFRIVGGKGTVTAH